MAKHSVVEWRIENLNHWCAEVHGDRIESPEFFDPCYDMELFPKGIGGKGEHLVVRLSEVEYSFSGDLSFCSPDGSLLFPKQQVNAEGKKDVLELPPGPKFEDVLAAGIREDPIAVRLRVRDHPGYGEHRVCTTINVLKISLGISRSWVEEMEPDETRDFFHVRLSPYDNLEIKIRSGNGAVRFTIAPITEYEDPFAVEMCLSSTGSDHTVDCCIKKEHLFRDDSPWTFPDSPSTFPDSPSTFPDPLQKKELDGKGISLFFCLKTKYSIQSPFYMSCANSCVSIESKNKICFSETVPSSSNKTRDSVTDSMCLNQDFSDINLKSGNVTSNKAAVLTKDSGSQTSLTSDLVLSKDLMCLYQDQNLSDITLKCHDVTFPVHKVILSARSPVFKTMFSTDMAEGASGEVDIGDLDPSTLSLFLTYLYTGRAVEEELQSERALKLYYAADKYQVPSLNRECSDILSSNVSISNVCDILSLSDRHSDDQLTSAAHDFILDNYNDVLKSNEWESFMCREPLLAVKTLTRFASKDRVRVRDPK